MVVKSFAGFKMCCYFKSSCERVKARLCPSCLLPEGEAGSNLAAQSSHACIPETKLASPLKTLTPVLDV